MMNYIEVGPFGLKADCSVINIMQDRILKSFMAASSIQNNQIVDIEYVELEPDPKDGPAPMATLVYKLKK